ncbi:ethanolamine permease [Brevibacterium mcbrellneri ATCC 49030]|uniref:Ethanolamine permease n=1 Tax=Brevibacterium mcbrellneri ATCC 49030 TaxID=585530 RepID=D4YQC0_9MICO|nr:ethanolamine permease [Brevibacterium mcbrellneri]EFG46577.1 ethanolamine permease [Brevibacterium mcbrellneri ATCC 49030]
MSKKIGTSTVESDYLAKRQLRKGAAGWVLLAGLGVAYVISGDFSGWNLGLAQGGWGGLAVAFVLMGIMYVCMTLGLAELSSTLPTAGAGYGFARRALGPLGGFVTGAAILIEYTMAPAAISTFIAGYVRALGILPEAVPAWSIYLVAYIIFVGIHVWGVGEALRLMFVITAIAVVALLAFVLGMVWHVDASNMFDITPDGSLGSSVYFPYGVSGILASLVFGIWFFLAIEGVPLAAEESANPKKDMPRGIMVAMGTLVLSGALMLIIVPGTLGASSAGVSDNPLPEAVRSIYGNNSVLATFVNWAGLAGLVASFFSIIFAYSRQLFALSRAGYLPRFLSLTGSKKTPYLALIVPGTIGFSLAVVTGGTGGILLNVAVFGATVSYVLLNLSHIVLRFKEPQLKRGYRTPGGAVTTSVALVLALIAVVATFFVDIKAAGIAAGVLMLFIAYFWFYSRRHLVAKAPEEEFSSISEAESKLN